VRREADRQRLIVAFRGDGAGERSVRVFRTLDAGVPGRAEIQLQDVGKAHQFIRAEQVLMLIEQMERGSPDIRSLNFLDTRAG
jgi:hypothetical protein